MQVSLRSQLVAGTAAVVGASAIAMTPVTQAHIALPAVQLPSAAEVALAGFDSPLSELIGTFSAFNQWMFSADNSTAGYLALGGLTDATGVGIAKSALSFSSIGLLPQVINDHMPILTQIGLNGAQTLESTMNSLTTMGLIGSEAVWNLPGAFVAATQEALAGNIAGAITTLQNAIVTPFVTAGQVALANGRYLLDNAVARGTALLSAVPTLADLVVRSTIGQASALANAFITVAQNVVAGVAAGSAEKVWNAAVDGVFGKNGIPGTIVNLTVGAGVQASPSSVVPSIRGEIQAVVHGVATALSKNGAAAPVPPPAAAQTPSASSLRAAAAEEPAVAEQGGSSSSSAKSGGVNAASAESNSTGAHAKSESAKVGARHGLAGPKRTGSKASAASSSD